MPKRNSENVRIKRRYLVWLKDARQLSESSIDKAAEAIDLFEEDSKVRQFRSFHSEQVRAFKRRLERATNKRSGRPLSVARRAGILRELRSFFTWLADQPGYKSKVTHAEAAYFSVPLRDQRAAQTTLFKPFPSLAEVKHALGLMPMASVFDRRNRALLAFLLLTGSRVTAATQVRLKHVDRRVCCVHFDSRQIDIKFGKSFTTFYYPVGQEIVDILHSWLDELEQSWLRGPEDPLFPKASVGRGPDGSFATVGLTRAPWSSAAPIRSAFKGAFEAAGLPAYTPHRIRDTIAHLGMTMCKTPEEFRCWSQNMAHEKVLTTLVSYGAVAVARQGEVMGALRYSHGGRRNPDDVDEQRIETVATGMQVLD
jgi:site-specific recombinase XerD